ncbi:MAG: hypothetical protein ACREYC_22400 [Gammaproteobacteria bacterium]
MTAVSVTALASALKGTVVSVAFRSNTHVLGVAQVKLLPVDLAHRGSSPDPEARLGAVLARARVGGRTLSGEPTV